MILDKGTKVKYSTAKAVFSTNDVGTLDNHMQVNLDTVLIPFIEINSKCIINLKCKMLT